MKILVTGGAGFIGSHVVDALVAAGHDVSVVDDLSTGRRHNLNPRARFYQVDIRDAALDDIIAQEKPDVVSHQAARANVRESMEKPILYADVNILGSLNLLESCRRHGVRKVIYASSGGTVYGEPESLPVTEEHAIAPRSNYGTSKYVGELYVQLAARTAGIEYTIFRYGNAYGPRQDPHGEAGVIAIFTGLMLNGDQCTIDGDGEQKKDYIYVGDIASANVAALTAGNGLVANIGTGDGITVNHIYRTLSDAIGNTVEPRFGPPRPGDVRNFWLDCSRAKAALGWAPAVAFEAGVARTVASYR